MLCIWGLAFLQWKGSRDRICWELTVWVAWGMMPPRRWQKPQASPQQGGRRNQLLKVICTAPPKRKKLRTNQLYHYQQKTCSRLVSASSELEVVGHEVRVSDLQLVAVGLVFICKAGIQVVPAYMTRLQQTRLHVGACNCWLLLSSHATS